jgi:hypothetical protein
MSIERAIVVVILGAFALFVLVFLLRMLGAA